MQHQARKRFGQNFLIASNIIDEIIAAINPRAGQRIVEIGPGLGALTYSLIQSQAQVYAVEIDRDLAAHLREKFTAYKNFHLHCHDILKFSLRELFNQQPQQKLRLIGNLPYNISTPLLFKLFSESDIISDMYFMLQREVAERLTAQPNNKQYGRLSITAQYYCAMSIVLHVPPTAFDPQPKVESCIVKFVPYAQPLVKVNDPELLQSIVTEAFNQRRKNIANSLKNFITADELKNLQIDTQARAENLSLEQYAIITNYLNAK